jgi:hypothetical protein
MYFAVFIGGLAFLHEVLKSYIKGYVCVYVCVIYMTDKVISDEARWHNVLIYKYWFFYAAFSNNTEGYKGTKG